MALVFQEWLNTNENRAYPINDSAHYADAGILLPNDILVDAQIIVPSSVAKYVCLSSVSISARLVTITFIGVQNDQICSEDVEAFVPIAVVNLVKPITRYRNYPVTPMSNGVGGWVSFGDGALTRSNINFRFVKPSLGQLCDRCVRAYDDLPVIDIGKRYVSPSISGLVALLGSPGQIAVTAGKRTIGSTERDVILIGLDTPTDGVPMLLDFAGTCGHRPSASTCNKDPIVSINGVEPNCNGNINLVFEGDVVVGEATNGLVLDSASGLGATCDPQPFTPIDENACSANSYPSSSHVHVPASSENSEVAASSTTLSAGYCETFDFGDEAHPTELRYIAGNFNVMRVNHGGSLSHRLIAPAAPSETIAADIIRLLHIDTGYSVKGVLRPGGDGAKEGHLIFGYQNTPDNSASKNYFVCGVTLAHPLYPDGCFFLARRHESGNPNADNIGLGLPGSNFQFIGIVYDAHGSPFGALQLDDYLVELVSVIRSGSVINVTWRVTRVRDAATTGIISHSIAVGWGSGNSKGRAGLGTFNSTCEFDSFGINCTSTFGTSDSLS